MAQVECGKNAERKRFKFPQDSVQVKYEGALAENVHRAPGPGTACAGAQVPDGNRVPCTCPAP